MTETREMTDPFTGKTVQLGHKLTDRLRGRYACGPLMPNGQPEFGYRLFDTPPVQHEAADRIDALEAALREAFRAGWYVNAAADDDSGDLPPDYQNYLKGCEEVDWQEYQKKQQDKLT